MLAIWYIWSRFFFFIRNELTPWPYIRYTLYKTFFFTEQFKYNQLGLLEKRFLGLFYTYRSFLPFSYSFTDNYWFIMSRFYFSPKGYLLISHEALDYYSHEESENLADFSLELKWVKQYKSILTFFNSTQTKDLIAVYYLLRYYTYKYYFRFYLYIFKSISELDRKEDRCFSPYSLFLVVCLSCLRKNNNGRLYIYNFYNYVDFFKFLRNNSDAYVSIKPKELSFTDNVIKVKYYTYLESLKKKYVFNYERFIKENFYFSSVKLQYFVVQKFNSSYYININSKFKALLQKSLFIRFSDSSVSKYISLGNVSKYTIYYIRKNRIFNKGRYSRNRQLYRTGVYWCLWLNILIVYGLYFFFYRFTFNFGYLWWGIAFFAFSFIFGRICQAKLYNPVNILSEFYSFYNWLITIYSNIYITLYSYYITLFNLYLTNLYSNVVIKKLVPILYNNRMYNMFLFFSEETKKNNSSRFVFFWEYFVGEDTSFLKFKSKIHWFKQVWRMVTQ